MKYCTVLYSFLLIKGDLFDFRWSCKKYFSHKKMIHEIENVTNTSLVRLGGWANHI